MWTDVLASVAKSFSMFRIIAERFETMNNYDKFIGWVGRIKKEL